MDPRFGDTPKGMVRSDIEPTQMSELDQVMTASESAVQFLLEEIEQLSRLLVPILSEPRPENPAAPLSNPVTSDLTRRIQGNTQNINVSCMVLSDLRSRIVL